MRRPPRVIEPAANRLVDLCGRQPEFFAMRVAHNSRSCRLLQRSWSPLLGSDQRRIGYQPIALPRSKAALLLAGVLWLHLGSLASKALPLSYTPTGARRAGVSPVRKAMKSAGTSSKPLAASPVSIGALRCFKAALSPDPLERRYGLAAQIGFESTTLR